MKQKKVCFNLGTRPGIPKFFALSCEYVDFDSGTVEIHTTKIKISRAVPVTAAFLERL
jgi:hypothetical protein